MDGRTDSSRARWTALSEHDEMGVESRSPPPASRRLRLAGRSLPGQRQLLAQAHWDPRLSLCTALSRPNPLFLPDIFRLLSPIFPHAPSFSPLSLLPSPFRHRPSLLPRRDPTRILHLFPFFPSNLASRRESLPPRVLLSLLPFSLRHSLSLSLSVPLSFHSPLHLLIATEYSIEYRASFLRISRFEGKYEPPLPRFPFQLFHQFSPRLSPPILQPSNRGHWVFGVANLSIEASFNRKDLSILCNLCARFSIRNATNENSSLPSLFLPVFCATVHSEPAPPTINRE